MLIAILDKVGEVKMKKGKKWWEWKGKDKYVVRVRGVKE